MKNRTLDPRFQFNLYRDLLLNGYVEMPCPRGAEIDYPKLKWIFQKISQFILRDKSLKIHEFYANLAARWLGQSPYSELVTNKLQHNRNRKRRRNQTEQDFINMLIDELDDDLEQVLKYDYTRGLKCYIDLVENLARENNETIQLCKELPLLLEAGAFDKKVLILLGIGLSRNSAIEIFKFIDEDFSSNLECVRWLNRNFELLKAKIRTQVIIDEIQDVLTSYTRKLNDSGH